MYERKDSVRRRLSEKLFEKQFQNHSRTTSGNPMRERGAVNEAIPKTSVAHASGYHGF
jgi:hypothetical protein